MLLLFLQAGVISHFAGERSASIIALRETAIEGLHVKLSEAEEKVSEMDGLRAKLEQEERAREISAQDLEKVAKERGLLKKELRASEAITQRKTDELDEAKRKLADFEDVQERLRLQVEKDANRISDLCTQVAGLDKELVKVKGEVLGLVTAYCDLVSSFGGRVTASDSSTPAKGMLAWLKHDFAGLPEFVHRVSDFAALSSANNLLSSLCQAGCEHFHSFVDKSFSFGGPVPAADLPKEVVTGVKRFIRDF